MSKVKCSAEGDTIGIVAPGSAVTDPDDIAKAIEAAKYFGFNYKIGKNVLHGSGYKSRSIDERVEDLHSAFSDDEIKAIICLRGGYGSAQLTDKLDYDLIRRHPKIFSGYSDITALHLAINKLSRLVTFHGPMLLSAFTNYTIDYFKKACFSADPIGIVENEKRMSGIHDAFPIRTVVPGKASGRLVGGNLTLVCNSLGTPYEIDTKGAILFIEEVGEQPYRVDRMLTQLRLAGKFSDAAGIVIGECNGCDYSGLDTSRAWDFSLGEIIDLTFGKLNVPTMYGLTFGHTANQATLPLGVAAELDTENKTLNITESGVA